MIKIATNRDYRIATNRDYRIFTNHYQTYMSLGFSELLLILLIVFVLFGAGKLPQVMNDIGKGIKNLKKGMKEEGGKDENKNS